MQLNSAVFILVDQEGRMLLQQRSFDTPIIPGYWAFFGGGIEQGETPLESVIREAKEEVCCDLKNPQMVHEQDFTLENADGHMRVFVEEFFGDKETLKLNEGQDWGWFTHKESEDLKMISHDRSILGKVDQYIKQIKQM